MISKGRDLRWGVYSLGFALVLLLLTIHITAAAPSDQSTQEGKDIFDANCSVCHSIGGGDVVAPDLLGVTERDERDWLASFISNPSKLIAYNDPHALALFEKYDHFIMPTLGLSREQINAVLDYLGEASTSVGSPVTPVAPAQLPPANPDNGRALFINDAKLANGGLACISCHNINTVGILGGGALGPDLTNAFTKYTGAGLAAVLADIPFPTMKPIYEDHSLTKSEQADLVAFIQSTAGQPQVNKETWILAVSLAGFLAVMALGVFYWRGRLRGVRQRLVEQAQEREAKRRQL